MAGHKPFSELRKDIDASPERLANVARERQEVEMDAAPKSLAACESDRDRLAFLVCAAQGHITRHGGPCSESYRIADALLADGRWLLVHPDEMIRRDQLEPIEVGNEDGHTAMWTDAEGNRHSSWRAPTKRVVGYKLNAEAFSRMRPAVEKENDQ